MTEALPSMRFAQKNVLVTGAAAGLGRHIPQAFAAEGADIAILDFQDASATALEISALKRRCDFFRSDVRDEAGVKKAVGGAAEFFDGRIDVLVNNAGFNGHYSLIKDMPLAHWRETIEINLTGTMLVTRTVLPFMLERKAGAIVTTASNVARRVCPIEPTMSARNGQSLASHRRLLSKSRHRTSALTQSVPGRSRATGSRTSWGVMLRLRGNRSPRCVASGRRRR
jgi:NAD(P)-dependent dehydrogenase (short-subunit alcohol dehydrogenase family)